MTRIATPADLEHNRAAINDIFAMLRRELAAVRRSLPLKAPQRSQLQIAIETLSTLEGILNRVLMEANGPHS